MSAKIPNCPKDCTAWHTPELAMFLLGVGRTKLYEMMNDGIIPYSRTDYGRRIKHSEIEKYLAARVARNPVANTDEHKRTEI